MSGNRISTSLYIGQKVVCIDDRWNDPEWQRSTGTKPKRSGVYTIRGFFNHCDFGVSVVLVEIINRPFQWGSWPGPGGYGEPSFYARRFRPAVEQKTDISVFTRMLVPGPKERILV